jgi:iron complex transport system substrate-binding protein
LKIQRKLMGFVVLCAMLAVFLAGCAETPEPPPEEISTITVVDHLGRTVELQKPAERVIGTHNPSMNMVVVLDGGGSRIAGFGNKDMAYGLYDLVAPEINEVTQIGKGKNINMETVMTVSPDLVVMPVRFKDQIENFTEIGVPCIALDVEKFDSIKDALSLIGKAMGETERAEAIIGFYDSVIEKVTGLAAKASEKPSVIMLSGSSNTAVSTDAMLQNLLIETAGGVNVTAGFQPDELWTDVDIEQIIAWNPDVIYIPTYADYTVDDILNDPQWATISAVKNKRVHKFPSALEPWDYPVAASSLGLCWTLHNLHPDLYTMDDLMQDVDEYYELVYGQTFSPAQLGLD